MENKFKVGNRVRYVGAPGHNSNGIGLDAIVTEVKAYGYMVKFIGDRPSWAGSSGDTNITSRPFELIESTRVEGKCAICQTECGGICYSKW